MPSPNEQIADTCVAELTAAKATGTKLTMPQVRGIILRALEQAKQAARIPTPEEKPVVHRKRNELLDSLVLVCGGNPEATTRAAFSAAAVALRDIKEVSPDLTPEMLVERAHTYKRKHPDWPLTVGALAKYWGELGGGGGATRSAKRDVYVEPPNWRPVLQQLYGLSDAGIADKTWLDLGPDTRRDLLARIYPNAK